MPDQSSQMWVYLEFYCLPWTYPWKTWKTCPLVWEKMMIEPADSASCSAQEMVEMVGGQHETAQRLLRSSSAQRRNVTR